MDEDKIRKLAEAHVEWYLDALKPQLIEHMIHGYKHGYIDAKNDDETRV